MPRSHNEKYTWEDLKKFEDDRREILTRHDDGANYDILFRHLTGTILEYLAKDLLFWFTILLWILFRILDAHVFDDTFMKKDLVLPSEDGMDSIGTFLSFILIFIVNSALSNYTATYGKCMKLKGKIVEMASVAKAVLPYERALRLVRWLNAAHVVGYTGLPGTPYTRENFFNEFNCRLCLLTKSELQLIDEINESMSGKTDFSEICTWVINDIQDALNEGLICARTAASLRGTVLDFQATVSSLFNDCDQPSISFFHFHLLTFLCAIYLPLFAITYGYEANEFSDNLTGSDFTTGLVVFIQCAFVIGLRLLMRKLMNPFGTDREDLSVLTYVTTAWESSNKILHAKPPSKMVGEEELSLVDNYIRKSKTNSVKMLSVVSKVSLLDDNWPLAVTGFLEETSGKQVTVAQKGAHVVKIDG